MCTSRIAFRTRNTFVVCALRALPFSRVKITVVVCALQTVLLERGILLFFVHFTRCFSVQQRLLLLFVHFTQCFLNEEYSCYLCTVFCALNAVLLELGILLLFVHFTECFWNEEYFCCLCTSRGAFSTRNTPVFCTLRALLLSTTKITVIFCALTRYGGVDTLIQCVFFCTKTHG